MNLFNILTIIIAVIVFLGLFIYTCVIYYNNNPTIFPKDMTSCPDFWTVNPDGTCKIPTPSGLGKPALNIGKLSQSQNSKYTVYTYPTTRPYDPSGKKLDTLLDVSNISYLSAYDDPGTEYKITKVKNKIVTNMPKSIIRDYSLQTPNPNTNTKVYRYDVKNTIPYGYSIRNPGNIDFNHPGWASYGDPYCAIQAWTKENGIAWDGMLAYNKC
jgi:hypothetical protein